MNYFQSARINPGTAASATITSRPDIFDVARVITDGLIRPFADGLREVTANFSDTMVRRPMRADRARARKYECGCGCEPEDPCQCTCCIVDADVVLYAYLGERRVIPLMIENRRHREKNVKLALHPFTTRAGTPAPINGTLVAPTEFKLGPCTSHPVVMVVDTAPRPSPVPEKAPDVDTCTVYYADMMVEGCEIRPIRIAVAILPRDCGVYRIDCHTCCC